MPTPNPIISPMAGTAEPMTTWASATTSSDDDRVMPNRATPMGTAMATTERSEKSRMTAAKANPMSSAYSDTPPSATVLSWASTICPEYATWTRTSRAGAVAASRSAKMSGGRSVTGWSKLTVV